MPKAIATLALGATVLLIAACGGSGPQEPVEQIIVRQPGDAAPAPIPAAASADGATLAATGKAAAASCAVCHAFESGKPQTVGPNLAGVVGRKAGTSPGFAYSEAMKASGIIWTEAELDAFLADPAGKVPGTAMTAGAVQNDDTRGAIIAWLTTLGGSE